MEFLSVVHFWERKNQIKLKVRYELDEQLELFNNGVLSLFIAINVRSVAMNEIISHLLSL